jgi:hypothetical protein
VDLTATFELQGTDNDWKWYATDVAHAMAIAGLTERVHGRTDPNADDDYDFTSLIGGRWVAVNQLLKAKDLTNNEAVHMALALQTMEKFWIAWGKRCPSAPPKNRMEASRREWHSDWADMIFWYGQTPEEMLDSLLEMQARAVKLKIACTNDQVKTKFRRLVLPRTTAFTTGKPPAIAAVSIQSTGYAGKSSHAKNHLL